MIPKLPTLTQLAVWAPKRRGTWCTCPGRKGFMLPDNKRWQMLLKGISEIFKTGATATVDRQKKTIYIRDNNFTARIDYTKYPVYIANWLIELSSNYEDLT